MRQAGTLSSRELAQRFVDYLLSQGITAKVDADGNDWAIWIRNEDQLPQSVAELKNFSADPNADRYRNAAGAAQALRKKQELEDERRRKNMIEVRNRWNLRPTGRRPLTMILIAACVFVAIATDGGENHDSELLNNLYFNPPPQQQNVNFMGIVFAPAATKWTPTQQIQKGQVWRLVTPIFIHYGPMHLIFNMYALYLFGSLIEIRRGTFRFGLLVLATAIFSNFCQVFIPYHFHWAGPVDTMFGGMSGVDYALFGYIWIKSRFEPQLNFFMPPNFVVMMLVWLVLCFTGWVGPIANWAHAGGLVSGAAIAFAPVAWRKLF